MKHSAQGAAGPGAGTAAAVRIPVQPSAADVARDRDEDQSRGQGRDASRARDRVRGAGEPDGAARGEHTHGEPPAPGPSLLGPSGPGPSAPGPSTPRPRTPVQRSSVRGQVLDALRAALVTGELRPGEVYSAPVLGERFGVSATPVREAMQQLALEGAVEVVPNRGFRVVERGDRELAELAEVRALIEVPVWLRLARTVPAERWAELRPLAEATARAASSGCPATYAEADRAFHRAVLALAGNEELVRIAGDVHRRAQWPPAGSPTARGRADLVADAHEHTALLDALIAGDPDAVRALVGQHFTGARQDSGVLGL
ncbi:GntR family transcriptional regulator [Streptomyces sp. H23]|uniref:GntR family transcriptional regulator n=1 Tax=unclassified Streptomyces TaxID=2593676 RepID=UPI00106EB7B0|nr:GntR family transcriptional regulator [Streptomyces sp. H23]